MIKDKTGQLWTKSEVQMLTLQVRSLNKARKRLGLKSIKPLRDLGILTPPEYVLKRAQTDPIWLRDFIIRQGDKKKAAKALNISITHLVKVLDEIGCNHRQKEPTREESLQVMKKFGSAIFASRVLETTPAQLIKVLGSEYESLKNPTLAGEHSVSTGYKAEKYVVECLGDDVIEWKSKGKQNHPGYDLDTKTYGKVNVKAAVRSKSGSWTWEYRESSDLDTLALVLLVRKTKEIFGFLLWKKSHLVEKYLYLKYSNRADGKKALILSNKSLIPEGFLRVL